jgi:hypothetical protein
VDSSPSEESDIEASSDLTAIYENQVYIVLDQYIKLINTPPRRKSWLGSPNKATANSMGGEPSEGLIISSGSGTVLIDSRK